MTMEQKVLSVIISFRADVEAIREEFMTKSILKHEEARLLYEKRVKDEVELRSQAIARVFAVAAAALPPCEEGILSEDNYHEGLDDLCHRLATNPDNLARNLVMYFRTQLKISKLLHSTSQAAAIERCINDGDNAVAMPFDIFVRYLEDFFESRLKRLDKKLRESITSLEESTEALTQKMHTYMSLITKTNPGVILIFDPLIDRHIEDCRELAQRELNRLQIYRDESIQTALTHRTQILRRFEDEQHGNRDRRVELIAKYILPDEPIERDYGSDDED